MLVFWITLGLVYIFALSSRYFAIPNSIGPVHVKPSKWYVWLTLSVLVLVSGLQNNIGDTYFYMHSYTLRQLTWQDIGFEADFGFNLLQMVLQRISSHPQTLIFIVAFMTNLLIITVLYRYSRLFELALYVYITSGLFLTSMNGIRQFLAAAIAFTATRYLLEGHWKKYMLVIALAATIHQSALVLIPVYFIVRREAWTRQTIILLGIAVIFVIGFEQVSHLFFNVIQNTKYSEYQHVEQEGANALRAVVYAVPLLLAYLGREKLRSLFPKGDYIVNLSILNLVFMIISTQQWIFARFSFYFGLYHLILITWIVKLFPPKQQRLVYLAILVCYFLYYYYESVISLNIVYRSDYIKF